MKHVILSLERLLHSIPEERDTLRPYFERAKSYSTDCGCSMSAAFLAVSFGLLIIYGFVSDGFRGANLLTVVLASTGFVFTSGVVGKLTGIGIARLRLALMYRQLSAKYRSAGG